MLETRPPGTARAAVDAAWPDGWQWVLDLRQSFAGLLDAALWLADREAAGDVFDDGGAALNLCLVTSAMQQILSDHLHRHFYDVSPLSGRLGPAAALGNLATAVAIRARQAWVRASGRDLIELEAELVRLQIEFGTAHRIGGPADTVRRNRDRLTELRRHRLPASLRRWRLKVPGAFRSMDLYPEDCAFLARKAEPLIGDRRTPVLVVGLRTSGLFMAPHAVAALRSDGFSTSSMLTIRPGVPLLRHELLEVRRLAAAGGWALVIDDPTWWGTAYAQSISALAAAGMPQDRICAAVCEIGNQPVLKLLDRRDDLLPHELAKVWAGFRSAPHVLLKRGEWEIDRLLENSAVEQTLNRPEFLTALGADSVSVLSGYHLGAAGEAQAPEFCVPETVPPLRQGRRFHAKKVFEVELLKGARRDRVRVLAKGAGLGFFGVHSLIAGRALNGLVPPVLGLHKGVLYSRWIEDGGRPDRNPASALKIGAYVAERARRLALPPDKPRSVFEGKAVLTSARRAARVLTRGLGPAGSIAQFRAEEEILFAIQSPGCVVDGQMRPREWIARADGSLVKTDFEEHGFDISDRAVVDPLFDIAQAVTAFGFDQRLEQALLRAAGDLGRGAGDRLLVHRLAAGAEELDSLHIELPDHQTADGRRRYAARLAGAEDALTRAVNSYLAGALPVEQPGPAEEVWVLDLDDTLETDRLGFPAQSPAGVRAVRALQRHGARVLLASGRSLAEVTERCQAFQLAGGVAEYGAVAWEACTGRTIPLIDDRSLAELDRLRAAVIETTEFLIDPRYTFSLRLFTHGAKGRRGVDAQAVRELVRRLGLQTLRVTEGWRKTVVVAEGLDKATALHRLLSSLGAGPSVEHAVGDAFTDLEVLRLARRRHAPANAGPELRALRRQLGIAIESRPYQAGVLQAVQRSVHGDRGCEPCDQVPEGALWRLLALQDEGRATKLRYLVDRRSARFIEL